MHWVWTGHAIISPSFRVNFETVREVYCLLPIRPEDTSVLVEMGICITMGQSALAAAPN